MKRIYASIRLFFVLLLLSSAILVSASRTSAQGAQPKYDPAVVKKAGELLGKYGIPLTALDNLVGMLNNPEKLTETLKGFGLSEDTINGMYKEALPLIQEAG